MDAYEVLIIERYKPTQNVTRVFESKVIVEETATEAGLLFYAKCLAEDGMKADKDTQHVIMVRKWGGVPILSPLDVPDDCEEAANVMLRIRQCRANLNED